MNIGYVKLYRKLIDSRTFQNEGLLKVWIWCLLKANHKEAWVPISIGKGITEIHVEPGQFIFGRDKAAAELRMNPSTVWKRIKKLKNLGNCDIQSSSHYSIITIINWDTYQPKEKNGDSQSNSQVTAGDTNKNDKNEKKDILSGKNPTPPHKKIVSYLNQKTGKKFKSTTQKTKSQINARWNEGFSLDDFKHVINVKTEEWINDPKMKNYLRPATLFGTKFDAYLNQEPVKKSKTPEWL